MEKFLGILAVLLILSSCGSPVAERSVIAPEELLRQRAEAQAQALTDGKYLEAYGFASPAYRANHSMVEKATELGWSIAMLKALIGIDKNEKLTWRVTGISVDGNKGAVWGEVLYQGEVLDVGDGSSSNWVLVEGQWYFQPEG